MWPRAPKPARLLDSDSTARCSRCALHHTLQRMLMLSGQGEDGRDLGARFLLRVNPANADALMGLKHEAHRASRSKTKNLSNTSTTNSMGVWSSFSSITR
jgi:hypothetical protein